MKSIVKLGVAALAVAGFAFAADAQAQTRGHGGGGHGFSGGSHSGWSRGGGGFRGGYRGGYWGPRFGLYVGAPLLIGGLGWPYYYGYGGYYDYPGRTVIYRDVERYPEYIESPGEVVPSMEAPRSEGAPTQGPLYMNYCESAKAYFPKVTACPEGWRLATPTR
jgi:hypothetical protein